VGVAVEDGALAAFFVVQEEGEADFGVVGPEWVKGVLPLSWPWEN
jgi:hypothetical protein